MLDALRRGARTWVAKALFFLLVLSFGVWGVTGSMFTTGSDAVLTVGETEVSANEFRLAYDRQLALASQQLGTRLTREQARAFGLESQVYAQLLSGALLDEQSRDMDLGLSEDRLAGLIAEDPAFRGIDGRFSRENFAIVLQNAGMTQDDYIDSRQQVAVRTQVVEALSDGFTVPDTMLAAIARHDSETRTVDYVTLTDAVIEPVAPPSEEELAAYFEENKARYAAPEYRKIAYLELTAETLADPAAITDEQVRADFEANQERYASQESRVIDQLLFPDRAAADAAAAALAEGTTFDELVAEQGRTAADVRLGSFTRETMASPELAEAAFAVEEAGGTTGVVNGPFGPVILRVAEIEGGDAPDLAASEDEIRNELALAEAAQVLFDVYDSIEDARAGGAPLSEVAATQQVETVTIEAVDRSGRTPEGEIVDNIPASNQLLAEAFEAEPGVESPPIALGSDGYVWFEVLEVEEARDRTLDEVRDQVVADWIREQTDAALDARVEELRQRVAGGETLAAIAAENGLAVETEYGLQRTSDDPIFGPPAIEAAFDGPRGLVAVAPSANGEGRLLMQVTDIVSSAAGGVDSIPPQEREAISARAASDLLDQLIARLQTEYPVSVNQAAGERALAF